jgi:hypothetical protein
MNLFHFSDFRATQFVLVFFACVLLTLRAAFYNIQIEKGDKEDDAVLPICKTESFSDPTPAKEDDLHLPDVSADSVYFDDDDNYNPEDNYNPYPQASKDDRHISYGQASDHINYITYAEDADDSIFDPYVQSSNNNNYGSYRQGSNSFEDAETLTPRR